MWTIKLCLSLWPQRMPLELSVQLTGQALACHTQRPWVPSLASQQTEQAFLGRLESTGKEAAAKGWELPQGQSYITKQHNNLHHRCPRPLTEPIWWTFPAVMDRNLLKPWAQMHLSSYPLVFSVTVVRTKQKWLGEHLEACHLVLRTMVYACFIGPAVYPFVQLLSYTRQSHPTLTSEDLHPANLGCSAPTQGLGRWRPPKCFSSRGTFVTVAKNTQYYKLHSKCY